MAEPKTDEFPAERIAKCLEGFYNLALERSRTGVETVLQRCDVCGAEEHRTLGGRLVIEHFYAAHHPSTPETVEITMPQRAGEYGGSSLSRAQIDREAVRARTKARAEARDPSMF